MGLTKRLAAAALAAAASCLLAGFAAAKDLVVMSSGGYTAALQAIAGDYEKATGVHLNIVLGPSMGVSPEAIPNRLSRGEKADLVVMVGYALGELIKRGAVRADSRVDLVDSNIAMAVKEGQPKPDISTVEALKKVLLAAKSVAYSDSASGVYIENELYKKLGIEAEMKPKSSMIVALRVGDIVAQGKAEIGFQQVSELLPIKGIAYVGEIPAEVQKTTVFSAGIPTDAPEPAAAAALLSFLVHDAKVRELVIKSGLQPRAP